MKNGECQIPPHFLRQSDRRVCVASGFNDKDDTGTDDTDYSDFNDRSQNKMTSTQPLFDIAIIGGGIIGVATAYKLSQRYRDSKILILESETDVGTQQTGHNSGVIHSGIYYQPGSTKAICCRTGKTEMESFCEEFEVPWDRCGKVVVATNAEEIPRLEKITQRARENGVEYAQIDTDQLRELEPSAAGIAAIHVPETGIVNFKRVCEVMRREFESRGGSIHFDAQVTAINPEGSSLVLTKHNGESIRCAHLINCAGLHSDRVCRLTGTDPGVQIVPFRGEYYDLKADRESLCRNLIYPVPDPSFPFLGVHFTRMIDGGVECGPNAVLAMSRSGYSWKDLSVRDLSATVGYQGFRRLARTHWRAGLGEIRRSLSKGAFVKALQKLMPSIAASDLVVGRTGVRAQAVTPDGKLADDFLFAGSHCATHVLNAPSPGATASLAIAGKIIEQFQQNTN